MQKLSKYGAEHLVKFATEGFKGFLIGPSGEPRFKVLLHSVEVYLKRHK